MCTRVLLCVRNPAGLIYSVVKAKGTIYLVPVLPEYQYLVLGTYGTNTIGFRGYLFSMLVFRPSSTMVHTCKSSKFILLLSATDACFPTGVNRALYL